MDDLNTNTFLSRDLYFSAYLLTTGHELLSFKHDTSGFFWFVFEDRGECELFERQFQLDELTVNAKGITESIKYLKRRVTQ
jgi:hypothetical protein